MAGGAGFVLDAMNTLNRNKGMRSNRSFLNGVASNNNTVYIPSMTKEEEILFENNVRIAKRNSVKTEVVMYAISFVITMFGFFLLNQILF